VSLRSRDQNVGNLDRRFRLMPLGAKHSVPAGKGKRKQPGRPSGRLFFGESPSGRAEKSPGGVAPGLKWRGSLKGAEGAAPSNPTPINRTVHPLPCVRANRSFTTVQRLRQPGDTGDPPRLVAGQPVTQARGFSSSFPLPAPAGLRVTGPFFSHSEVCEI
jgi:hypothetical protein